MNELDLGSLVRLKSGGPLMTVTKMPSGANDDVRCSWFDENTACFGGWPREALETVPAKAQVKD